MTINSRSCVRSARKFRGGMKTLKKEHMKKRPKKQKPKNKNRVKRTRNKQDRGGVHMLSVPALSFRTLNSVRVKCPMNRHLTGEYRNIGGDHYVKDSKYHLNKNSENYWQIFINIPIMSASQLNSEPDLEQVAKDGEEGQNVLAVYTDYAAEEGEHPPTGKQRWTSSPIAVYLPAYAGPVGRPSTFWLHEDDKDWMRVYSEGKFMWVKKKLRAPPSRLSRLSLRSRRKKRARREMKEIGEPDDFSWIVSIELIITVKDKSPSVLSRDRPSVLSPINTKDKRPSVLSPINAKDKK